MAAIQNDRDVLLQAASVRVVPVSSITLDDVVGLTDALAKAEKSLEVTASSPYFSGPAGGSTTPSAITLSVVRKNGLTGTVSWAVESGSATLTPAAGDSNTCSINGSTVAGAGVTVRARVTDAGRSYDARVTVGKFGTLSLQNNVSLVSQVTGQLASGNVSGLGALALLNTIHLNTQTTGALNLATQTTGAINANTQVTNLGSLAFANAIAANQIGAGQLAAGVIYAGTVHATQVSAGSFSGREFTGGTFTGALFRTAASGPRFEIRDLGVIEGFDSSGTSTFMLTRSGTLALYGESLGPAPLLINPKGKCHMRLAGKSSFPSSSSEGDVLMHTTHGLCIYTGSVWKACNMISI